MWHVIKFQHNMAQRPKNAGGRVALPPGRFGFIRKIYGHGLLPSLEKRSEQPKICPDRSRCVWTTHIMSGQHKMCQDSSNYVQTAQNVSGPLKIYPDS